MISGNITKNEKLDQIKSKVVFDNLKSDYFLIKIFNIIKKNKSLKIVKNNKKLQKRLNLSINDYKEYTELYSPIEIELEVAGYLYQQFIQSTAIGDYYHIYFDNSNEEIYRNFLKENDYDKKIKIIIDYQVRSFYGLFSNCKNIY